MVASVLAGSVPTPIVGFAKLWLSDEQFGPIELLGIAVGSLELAAVTNLGPTNLLEANATGQTTLVLAAAVFALDGVLTQ